MDIDWKYLFTNFEGRINRKDYWIGIAAILILQLLSYMLFGGGLVGIVMRVLLALAGFAVQVKRCHDWGKTGWLSLLSLIPFFGTIWLVVLGLVEGEKGANKWGAPPRLTEPSSTMADSQTLAAPPEGEAREEIKR